MENQQSQPPDQRKRILGIDPGTRCGWAVWHGEVIAAGTWDLSSRRFEGGGMRFLRFEQRFSEALAGVDLVAFEEVRKHMGVDAAHVYGGIVAVLTKVCEAAGKPYHAIPVGTIKKFATGKGNVGKEPMIAAANKKWGLTLGDKDDNEADARWIAETAASEFGGA